MPEPTEHQPVEGDRVTLCGKCGEPWHGGCSAWYAWSAAQQRAKEADAYWANFKPVRVRQAEEHQRRRGRVA